VTPFVGFTFPLLVRVSFGARSGMEVAQRTGWTVFAHVAPGVTLQPVNFRFSGFGGYTHGFALTAGVGIGYQWW
jgi:hypothetical protein